MFTSYIQFKLKSARYKILADRTFFGMIPGMRGVWANARTLEKCRQELEEVLEEWLLLKVRNRESIAGLKIRFDRKRMVRQ